MKISTRGRYALRVVIDLAEHFGQSRVPLKDIASRQNISLKYLEGIMTDLSKSGIVVAQHGKGGGYSLANGCKTLGMWKRLHEMVMSFFDGITIADLAESGADGFDYVI